MHIYQVAATVDQIMYCIFCMILYFVWLCILHNWIYCINCMYKTQRRCIFPKLPPELIKLQLAQPEGSSLRLQFHLMRMWRSIYPFLLTVFITLTLQERPLHKSLIDVSQSISYFVQVKGITNPSKHFKSHSVSSVYIQGVSKKRYFSDFRLIFVLEVLFYFFIYDSESEFVSQFHPPTWNISIRKYFYFITFLLHENTFIIMKIRSR